MASLCDNVPAPMDANGCVVPLDTKELVCKGETREVYGFSYSTEPKVWHVQLDGYDEAVLNTCTMPDSWERLLKDLDRAADASGNSRCACSYLTGDASTECDDCRFNEDARWCVRIMAADVARRIRALREADENAD